MALTIEQVICDGIEKMQMYDLEKQDIRQAEKYEEKGKYKECAELILYCLESTRSDDDVEHISMLKQIIAGTYGKKSKKTTKKSKKKSTKK